MIGHNVTSSRPQRSRLGDCLDSTLRFFSIALLQYMPVYGQLSRGSAIVLSHKHLIPTLCFHFEEEEQCQTRTLRSDEAASGAERAL